MSSSLIVEICEIKEIKEHKNADALEILVIKGWESVSKKGEYKAGDTIIYIPPDVLVPEDIIEKYSLKNYLAGKKQNRVKCIRLRGEMSFGLVLPNEENLPVGTEVSEKYGYEKYIPPIRITAGDAAPEDPFFDRYTDIENIRNFPDVFEEGEMVVVSEKIDGSSGRSQASKNEDNSIEYKSGSHKVKRKRPETEEELKTNTYWYPFSVLEVKNLLTTTIEDPKYKVKNNITLYDEIYGKVRGGHKSLHYGKQNSLNLAAFDIKIDGNYVDYDHFKSLCDEFNVPTVPIVAITEFSIEKMKELSRGKSILAAKNGVDHMREGIVIRPLKERRDRIGNRVILKMLNDDYLILKNKREAKGEEVDFTDE